MPSQKFGTDCPASAMPLPPRSNQPPGLVADSTPIGIPMRTAKAKAARPSWNVFGSASRMRSLTGAR